MSKYEFSMELLCAMACKTIAERHSISWIEAFDRFIKSLTGKMLFDDELTFWWNGPDYIADEYEKEMNVK